MLHTSQLTIPIQCSERTTGFFMPFNHNNNNIFIVIVDSCFSMAESFHSKRLGVHVTIRSGTETPPWSPQYIIYRCRCSHSSSSSRVEALGGIQH